MNPAPTARACIGGGQGIALLIENPEAGSMSTGKPAS
jgi:hypothetical protein